MCYKIIVHCNKKVLILKNIVNANGRFLRSSLQNMLTDLINIRST